MLVKFLKILVYGEIYSLDTFQMAGQVRSSTPLRFDPHPIIHIASVGRLHKLDFRLFGISEAQPLSGNQLRAAFAALSRKSSKLVHVRRSSNPQTFYSALVKILLLGSEGAGKTSLFLRFADDCYTDTFISTIGHDFRISLFDLIEPDGFPGPMGTIKVQVFDVVGARRFRTISSSYFRACHAVLLIFDVNRASSFEELASTWYPELIQKAEHLYSVLLVGTKCDVDETQRQVSRQDAEAFARSIGARYIETSAKASYNCEAAFEVGISNAVDRMFATGVLPLRRHVEEPPAESLWSKLTSWFRK